MLREIIIIVWVGVAVAALIKFGYYYGKIDAEQMIAQQEIALRDKFNEDLKEAIKAKDEAINNLKTELTAQVATNNELKLTSDKLRDNLNRANEKLSRSNNSCVSEREALRRCQGLLIRGTDLLGRGTKLLSDTAINNDTLLNIVERTKNEQ